MGRKSDLEQLIRNGGALIREYEMILQISSDPKEKARAQHAIAEQIVLLRRYLAELSQICHNLGTSLPTDIAEIAAGLDVTTSAKSEGVRSPTPFTPSPKGLPTGPIRNRWALLVGNDTYIDPGIPPLKYCAADVLALQTTLEAAGYTVVVLHDDSPLKHRVPTRDNVEAELAHICKAAEPDDLIWVHFSCHGKLSAGKPVLITHETRIATLAEKALPLAEVKRTLRASPARRLVLTLDACHTGVEMGRDLSDPEFIRNSYELAEGFALLAASTSQQIAQEWAEKQHGVFTYFLLEGLNSPALRGSKNFITVHDLTLHTLAGLRRWNVAHSHIIQDPTAHIEGMGDMILVDFREPDPALTL